MKIRVLFASIPLFFILSCQNEEAYVADPREQGPFFVGPEEAEKIAANVGYSKMFQSETTQVPSSTKSAQSILEKEVQSSVAVNDERGVASYYIINYDGGGFVILSADKRTQLRWFRI